MACLGGGTRRGRSFLPSRTITIVILTISRSITIIAITVIILIITITVVAIFVIITVFIISIIRTLPRSRKLPYTEQPPSRLARSSPGWKSTFGSA